MKTTILDTLRSFNRNLRNPMNRTLSPCCSFIILLLIACFALLPAARAVSPAPDACYPNFTTAEGCDALFSLTTGSGNTGLGWRSLFLNTDGSFNTGVGGGALTLNNGSSNTAVGAAALLLNTTGSLNTAVGTDAMVFNDSGAANTATGYFALMNNTTGDFNTATGEGALVSNTTGFSNTAIGLQALFNNTSGEGNTALGVDAGAAQTTGSNNVYIGAGMNGVAGESNACYIKSIFGQLSSGGTAVFVNSDGKLGTTTSSRRFKDDIRPMDNASEVILALKPVTFHYKQELDPEGIPQFGLVAEEVEKVNPDLVVRDADGKVNTVRYDAVNAMVLNEFLKEHREVEEQQATITQLKSDAAKQEATISQLKKGMGVLTAQLKEQAAQIQKVSAQLELNNSATRTVASDH